MSRLNYNYEISRVFGGKRYHGWKVCWSKKDAEEWATKARRHGYLARITKKNGSHEYTIWVYHKKIAGEVEDMRRMYR